MSAMRRSHSPFTPRLAGAAADPSVGVRRLCEEGLPVSEPAKIHLQVLCLVVHSDPAQFPDSPDQLPGLVFPFLDGGPDWKIAVA